ncbi:hypothetical protein OB955_16640 [Halobacteria archaeon AArc-m2/3/4]|uniref:DUF8074 domain-containing protein n=1 Tax=Natronoglomus mannanivorans TaxID=2979990 RepID=A0AAP2Z2S8_9EURY|nr:hypothetical protein [Halobacteria archaeon AArc-xg1-1]MCU4974353.1 hypothetical protein [Halobacteria archaeon AArc-m2/3/4]
MELSMTDVTVYIYNVAVVLTGGFLIMEAGIEDRAVLIGLAAVLGLFWTVYFRYSMAPKLASLAGDDDDDENDNGAPDPGPDRL